MSILVHSKSFCRWAMLLIATLLALQAEAAGPFTEGVNYQSIRSQAGSAEPASGKVKVIEFFWYDCQTCFVVQPAVQRWKAERGDDVDFERMPAVVGDHMVFYARAFYTAKTLGILDRIHADLYAALHRYGRDLESEEQLAEFFAEHGVDRTRFFSTFRGSATSSAVDHAHRMSRLYELQGAPSFVVNGRYRVDPTMVRSAGQLVQVVDYLVDRELQQ